MVYTVELEQTVEKQLFIFRLKLLLNPVFNLELPFPLFECLKPIVFKFIVGLL
jgi:hypothetical protein